MRLTTRLLLSSIIFVGLATSSACGDEESCSSNDDCFAEEVCSASGSCVAANSSANVSTNNSTSPNGSTNGSTNNMANGSTNNTVVNNSSTTSTNNLNPNNGGTSCEVDPFTVTCDDDRWEENDESNREELPIDSQEWCAGGTLADGHAFSGTFCAGDPGDFYRILVDNRTPTNCLTGPYTMRIEVTIEQMCNPERIQVEPYYGFQNPALVDICADDEDVRCTSFDGGQRRVIEWRRTTVEQLPDFYLVVGSGDDNVQFDYDVSLSIIP